MIKSHHLAAIMFTDIVGYTQLMEQDEKRALDVLIKNKRIQKSAIQQFNGKLLKELGDGTLTSFNSVIDAVHCAISIIQSSKQIKDLRLRIGIHLGEIVEQDNDIFGDGVNIASRLESLAPVGGILVSESVFDNIKNQAGIQAKYLGQEKLKNVQKPIDIYQITIGDQMIVAEGNKLESNNQAPSRKLDIRKKVLSVAIFIILVLGIYSAFYFLWIKQPSDFSAFAQLDRSIAVLPFKNLSQEEGSQYFSEGMMDAILNNLALAGDLKVVSRTSTEQYRATTVPLPQIAKELNVNFILEGSVQRYGNNVRIIVQLIDAKTDTQIWSESYDRELVEVFQVQSNVAESIAYQLQTEFSQEQLNILERTPTNNIQAYDLYLRGRQHYYNFSIDGGRGNLTAAIEYYKKAIELDPGFFLAKVQIGWTYLDRVNILGEGVHLYDSAIAISNSLLNNHSDRSELLSLLGTTYRFKGINKQQAKELLVKAVRLDPNDPMALTGLAWYYSFEENRQDLALYLRKLASEIEPQNPFYLLDVGWSWMLLDSFSISQEIFEQAITNQPNFSAAFNSLCTLHIIWNGDFEKGLNYCETALEFDSAGLFNMHHLAQYYSWVGAYDKSYEYFTKIVGVVKSEGYTVTRNTPWFPHRYAYTLWRLGRKQEAEEYFQEQIDRDVKFLAEDIQTWDYNAYYDLAAVYAFLGDKKEAFYWLNKLLENNSWGPPSFIVKDPLFSNLKGEAQFKEYIDSYNLRIWKQRANYQRIKDLSVREFIDQVNQSIVDLQS